MRLGVDQVIEDLSGIQEHLDNADLDERVAAGAPLEPYEEGFAQGLARADYVAAARELVANLPEDVRELAALILGDVEAGADLPAAAQAIEELIGLVRRGIVGLFPVDRTPPTPEEREAAQAAVREVMRRLREE